ncbi:LysR family transcriptional regulator [Shewanella sp. HN-41]|uniref:LysR family transcriptional regulator n=1 Tax=Shewanella sp. HN-41 TaxID=327275 RepID=UPI00021260B8|nr:LysR family transcriptional regulator [Shewanella sp. HN-41]EGM68060.1 transcriptional regulator, LysR family [Shewanella sp. HN-41]
MIDLNEMLVFVKLAETGSFIQASRALKMPAATVSRRIASLEQRLDVRLVHRTTRHVGLTDEGQRLFLRAAPVIREALEVEQSILAMQPEPKGLLRITSTPLFAKEFLSPTIARFLQRYPDVEVDLVATTRRVNLIDEGFDLGFRSGPLQDSSLKMRHLFPGQSVICASPDYIAQHGRPEKLEDLQTHDCIIFAQPGRTMIEWSFDTDKGPLKLPVNGRLKVNSLELACNAAVNGVGIAKIPAFIAEPEIKANRLCLLLEGMAESSLTLFAVYPAHRQLSAKTRKFIDLLIEHMEKNQ